MLHHLPLGFLLSEGEKTGEKDSNTNGGTHPHHCPPAVAGNHQPPKTGDAGLVLSAAMAVIACAGVGMLLRKKETIA